MESPDIPLAPPTRRKKLIGLALVLGPGLIAATILLLLSGTSGGIRTDLLVWSAMLTLAAYALSLTARWMLTPSRKQTYLLGRIPMALALLKIVGLVCIVALLLVWLVALVTGPPLSEITLHALIVGLLAFPTLSFGANTMLNLVLVARHMSGTLEATSREGNGKFW